MPITELVFPQFKTDEESQALLASTIIAKLSNVFDSSVEGLHVAYQGPIIEEDGVHVDDQRARAVYALEWLDTIAFHDFFPASPKYQDFVKLVGPVAAAKPVPELYEAPLRSTSTLSVPATQIIKSTAGKAAEGAWKALETALTAEAGDEVTFYHANGVEKDDGIFLGLIGWKSLQAYEHVGKQEKIRKLIAELGKEATVKDYVVELALIRKA